MLPCSLGSAIKKKSLGNLVQFVPLLGVIYKWIIYGLVFSGCANLHSKKVSSSLLDTTKCQSTSPSTKTKMKTVRMISCELPL